MLDIKEIRQKTISELETELENIKKELFRIHCRQVTDVVQNHSVIKGLRKNIARLNTIIKEKQNTSNKPDSHAKGRSAVADKAGTPAQSENL